MGVTVKAVRKMKARQGMALSWYPRVLSGLDPAYSLCKQGMNEFSVTLSWWRVTEVTAKEKIMKI